MGQLDGKVAIVTGAARGLGAAIARRYVREGAKVWIADINDELGAATATEIGASYRRADVSDWNQVHDLIEAVVGEHGRLDILVNNAAILAIGLVPTLPMEDWDRIFQVNVNSVFYGCRAAIPHMQAQGGGAIVNIGSIAGLRGNFYSAPYNATKAAVVNLTRSMGIEYAEENIRINVICPGTFATEMNDTGMKYPEVLAVWRGAIPAQRFAQPDEIAGLAVLLGSDDARFICGAAIPVDGGITAGDGMPNWTKLIKQFDLPV